MRLQRNRFAVATKSVQMIIVVLLCFLYCIQAHAQEKLLPNQAVAKSIPSGETQTYTIPLKDGDYVRGSIDQHGTCDLSIRYSDGSLLREFPGSSADGKRTFAFVAEGQGNYFIKVSNRNNQSASYELLLDTILPLDERLKPQTVDQYVSPRLQALRSELASGRTNTDAFWKEIAQKGTPLIEPYGSDGKYYLVTFLWRGRNDTRNVAVIGSFEDPVSQEELTMRRIGTSDVWYLTVKIPTGARFVYDLSPNDPITWEGPRAAERNATRQADPLNPRRTPIFSRGTCTSASVHGCRNVVELQAPPQPWTVSKPGTPRGQIEKGSIRSTIQGIERPFSVYTPANYKKDGSPNALLVLFDAGAYLPDNPDDWYDPNGWQTLTTLNELVAASKIPPTVVVFVNNVGSRRLLDLIGNPGFADFVATELVPWVRAHYNITTDPARSVVGGYSASGFAAAYMGLRHSEVFGSVISMSGAFWWSPEHNAGLCTPVCQDAGYVATRGSDATTEENWMLKQFLASRKLPLRFHLDAGTFETDRAGKGGDILEATRALRDVLLAKGYEVHYQQFVGGHDGLSWRGTLADALIALLGSR